jgi:hypothetical protein
MQIPIDADLYELAKSIVYPRYKKPSAYRSGALVKQYKKLGGRYLIVGDNIDDFPLARWQSGEMWLNLNALLRGQELPCGVKYKGQIDKTVCRPKYKVNDKTPKPLAGELTPSQIKKAIKQKNQGMRVNWANL